MKSGVILLGFLFVSFLGHSQTAKTLTKLACASLAKVGDCSTALDIKPANRIQFGCTPEGHGKRREIKGNSSNSAFFFEKEHNSIWLKFEVSLNAMMTFRIIPIDTAYDYDFLLFKEGGENFCNRLAQKNVQPVRSNISRNNEEAGSITGLAVATEKSFVRSGPGSMFSNGIEVEKGEIFYLVIDNVRGGKKGFTLQFKYYRTKEITGTIKDEETQKPLKAEITWEDAATGELLAKSQSDAVTGEYQMNVPLEVQKRSAKYILTGYSDKHFFSEKTVTAVEIQKSTSGRIIIVLPQLKKGGKAKLHNINFRGNSPIPLESAQPTFKRLDKIMSRNPSLKIEIEGHTNGCSKGVKYSQDLSEARANMVRNHLMKNGVAEKRIRTRGYNCSKMLYPKMLTGWEQSMNRRVEILFTEYSPK